MKCSGVRSKSECDEGTLRMGCNHAVGVSSSHLLISLFLYAYQIYDDDDGFSCTVFPVNAAPGGKVT